MTAPVRRLRREALNADRRGGGSPDWTMTFADMMSLLMGFFLLLLSFSTIDPVRFVDVSGRVQGTFGGKVPVVPASAGPSAPPGQAGDRPLPRPDAEVRAAIASAISSWQRTVEGAVPVSVFDSYRGVEVTLPADRLFTTGSDHLLPTASGLLALVSQQLHDSAADRVLSIEVAAENSPPDSPQYEDGLNLAMARAIAVFGHLTSLDPRQRTRIVPGASFPREQRAPQVVLIFESPDVRPSGGRSR